MVLHVIVVVVVVFFIQFGIHRLSKNALVWPLHRMRFFVVPYFCGYVALTFCTDSVLVIIFINFYPDL